jgi:hypothetical protein
MSSNLASESRAQRRANLIVKIGLQRQAAHTAWAQLQKPLQLLQTGLLQSSRVVRSPVFAAAAVASMAAAVWVVGPKRAFTIAVTMLSKIGFGWLMSNRRS